ncbi:MAG: phosphate ABC transporter permease PstA [Actinomycetaceae bacterium]|nr:phosphate ABC transporter permease PstA [Actinomycetaceae bacterium]
MSEVFPTSPATPANLPGISEGDGPAHGNATVAPPSGSRGGPAPTLAPAYTSKQENPPQVGDNLAGIQALIFERKLRGKENETPKPRVALANLDLGSLNLSWRRRAGALGAEISLWMCAIVMLGALGSIIWELVRNGAKIISPYFVSVSMNGVYGGMNAGGVYHAILGTFLVTLCAASFSVPIGLLVAIYLVEYGGRSKLARVTTTLVDVMTGIPSIVAGLFAAALFMFFLGPAYRSGFMGAVALSVLMVPLVVRSGAEMLRLVPCELREASYALGVPKWKTIWSIILPSAAPGLITSVVVAIARIIGETAPLLLTAGNFQAINNNVFVGRMETLPVYIYQEYISTVTCSANIVNCNPHINIDRAWGAALVLVAAVLVLNLGARALARTLKVK